MAIGYFQDNATVAKVVVFKFFRPREAALSAGYWEVPALAIAFEYTDPLTTEFRVRVSEIESFGNAAIPESAIDELTSYSGFPDFEPLDGNRADKPRLPRLPIGIKRVNPFPGLHVYRTVRGAASFDVSMPAPFGVMSFNLVRIFDVAVVGRFDDEESPDEGPANPHTPSNSLGALDQEL